MYCSSFNASSSRGRLLREVAAPKRNLSFQSSISAMVRPCVLAASWIDVCPLRMLRTKAPLRFAIQRCVSCSFSIVHLQDNSVLMVARFQWGQYKSLGLNAFLMRRRATFRATRRVSLMRQRRNLQSHQAQKPRSFSSFWAALYLLTCFTNIYIFGKTSIGELEWTLS